MTYNDGRNYPFALSIDMRVFDNQERDYGVKKFIERLGFTPDYVFNHETYVGQVHSHNGILDDTLLLPTWVAQRAIPGCQLWTRNQYKECVDVLHDNGVKFFQGAEAAWSQWPEFGEISKDTWIHEHMPEMFTTYRNGNTTKNEMGMICPLKRMKDGVYYEDFLLKDLMRYLEDYNMDGFFAADGFGGLATQLVDGDYSEDMISQFTEKTNNKVPGQNIPEKAAYIWENLRYEWITFYADRWASFYVKMTKGFKSHNKDLIVMAPFKHGPADALYKYGYDYAKNAAAGLDFYALESMETNSHRWQNMQSMAATGISNVTTIKAIAPNTRIMWMSATCNCPEHWHTLRDHPGMLERECISLNTARAIGPSGETVKGFTGVQPLFGIDLDPDEWRWYRTRMDIGHMDIVHNEGLVNVWSQDVLYENTKRKMVYPYTFETVRLRFSGLPIHCTVDIKNVSKVRNKSLVLIQPLGIKDSDVETLKNMVEKEGKILIVAGEVENPALLKLLGINRNNSAGTEWAYAENSMMDTYRIPEDKGRFDIDWGGYSVTEAKSIVKILNAGEVTGTGLSVNALGKGYAIFIRVIRKEFPKMNYRLTDFHVQSHPRSLPGGQDGLLTIREVTHALAEMHPGSYELICARLVQLLDGTFPYSDKGQVLACTGENGKQYLFVENPLNLQYIYMTVTLPKEKKYVMELPIRKNGPMGYQYYGDTRPKNIDVCIPPEALIPFRIDYRE